GGRARARTATSEEGRPSATTRHEPRCTTSSRRTEGSDDAGIPPSLTGTSRGDQARSGDAGRVRGDVRGAGPGPRQPQEPERGDDSRPRGRRPGRDRGMEAVAERGGQGVPGVRDPATPPQGSGAGDADPDGGGDEGEGPPRGEVRVGTEAGTGASHVRQPRVSTSGRVRVLSGCRGVRVLPEGAVTCSARCTGWRSSRGTTTGGGTCTSRSSGRAHGGCRERRTTTW